MRARRLRPSFDRLDTRLVLSDSGGTMVSGGNLASTILDTLNPSTPPPDSGTTPDWYLPGSPPPPSDDPYTVEIPWTLATTTN